MNTRTVFLLLCGGSLVYMYATHTPVQSTPVHPVHPALPERPIATAVLSTPPVQPTPTLPLSTPALPYTPVQRSTPTLPYTTLADKVARAKEIGICISDTMSYCTTVTRSCEGKIIPQERQSCDSVTGSRPLQPCVKVRVGRSSVHRVTTVQRRGR
jgi:hypothetical protein